MSGLQWAEDGMGAPPGIALGGTPTANRFVRFAGAPPNASLCTSGQDADAVTLAQSDNGDGRGLQNQSQGFLAVPGLPVQVEAGAAFASGATLQSDGTGRAITQTTGVAIARALEAATAAGQIKWVCFLSGR